MGLASRRRYRWTGGRVGDYWDKVFTPDGLEGHAALDDQSAFIASLGGSQSARMRDVLGTIATDQDASRRQPSATATGRPAQPSSLGSAAGQARKSSSARLTWSVWVHAIACGPPSMVTSRVSLIRPGSRAPVLS
jgi:hypothetical protein